MAARPVRTFPAALLRLANMSLFKDLRMDCLWADLYEHFVGGSWMDKICVGVDVGKEVHWACVLDGTGMFCCIGNCATEPKFSGHSFATTVRGFPDTPPTSMNLLSP